MPQGTNRYGFRLFINGIMNAQHVLTINPQNYQQSEPSRTGIYETFGGAYADSYGRSPSYQISISGHTGYRGKEAFQSGYQEFLSLRNNIYRRKDMPGAKVIFDNYKDNEHYVVEIMDFQLTKTTSTPVLYNYSIPMRTIQPYSNLLPIEDGLGEWFSKASDQINEVMNNLNIAVSLLTGLLVYPIPMITVPLNFILSTASNTMGILGGIVNTVGNWDVLPITQIQQSIQYCEDIRAIINKDPGLFASLNITSTIGIEQFENALKQIEFENLKLTAMPTIYPDQETVPNPGNTIDTYDKSIDEDLQSMALKIYGDANKYQLIAEMNNITPDDAAEGTSGSLIVPKANYSTIVGQEKSSQLIIQLVIPKGTPITKTMIENVLYGMDIKKDISISGMGDIKTVSGLDNIKQALLNKMECYAGTLLENTNYGTILDQVIGSPGIPEKINQINTEINRTLLSDERVDTVDNIKVEQLEDDSYQVTVDLTLIGGMKTKLNNVPL